MPSEAAGDAADLKQAFWLAARGVQQMDLAGRFATASQARSIEVLALKGISIADELYGGAQNRPMADVDFLVVHRKHFEAAADEARALGLIEIGASDHALVFKEPGSGVVLELHIALTTCPGLFAVDHAKLWERRGAVSGTPMFRLSDEDLAIHLALHTTFQHGFAANDYHYGDFVRLFETRAPDLATLIVIAREAGALKALGAMAAACLRERNPPPSVAGPLGTLVAHCPPGLSRFIESQVRWPPLQNLKDLASVRYQLAPSRWRYLAKTLAPAAIPGRTLHRPGPLGRILHLAGSLETPSSGFEVKASSLPERIPTSEVAERWIRECLTMDPEGVELTVSGTCMEPALMEGTRIKLGRPSDAVRVGDVVLLRTPGGLRLHRVVLRLGGAIRTKGDRGIYLDPAAQTHDVIAVQRRERARFGEFARAVQSLGRLLSRPFRGASGAARRGDAAHARLLP